MEGDPELLTEAEFEEMMAFARAVEAQPVREYVQRGPSAGGPKKMDPNVLLEARVELRASHLTQEHHEDLLAEAKILRLQSMKKWLELGVPVQFIAEAVGYKERSQVYQAVNVALPKLERQREMRQRLIEDT